MRRLGHVSLDYNAEEAVLDTMKQSSSREPVYKDILMQCLRQIKGVAEAGHISTTFTVPSYVTGTVITYKIADAIDYLEVALCEDRKFEVRRIGDTMLYIRWESEEQKRERRRRARQEVKESIPKPAEPLKMPYLVEGYKDRDDTVSSGLGLAELILNRKKR